MPDEILLNEVAYAVWQTVNDRGPIELGEVVRLTGIDQAQVSAAATDTSPLNNLLLAPKGLGWEIWTPRFSHGGTRLSPGSFGKAGGGDGKKKA